MKIINSEEKLDKLIKDLKYEKTIGIDTEFVRRDTYYAKLCLVQLSTTRDSFIIDPLAVDISPFSEILINPETVKIFHAPYQDLGIFHHDLKIETKNIFDTQEAVKLLKIKNQISYQEICSRIIGVNINKTQKFREWGVRPLPEDMLEYALQDVKYLIPLYLNLRDRLKANRVYKEFKNNMELLDHAENYNVKTEEIWKKIDVINQSQELVDKIKILAEFRENAAMELDIPRQHFLKNQDLIHVAENLPKSEEALARLCLKSGLGGKYKNKLLDICASLSSD